MKPNENLWDFVSMVSLFARLSYIDLLKARIASEATKDEDEKTEADIAAEQERLSKINKYVKEKICWIRSRGEPSSSSNEADEESDEGKDEE